MLLTEKLTAIADAIRVQSGKTGKLTLDQMPSEIVDLQSLGFEVVGGTTAPNSPKENTIWVNTDVEITSWAFSATEPENPSEGMVWISTGTSSRVTFNALKKNNITVYPMLPKQYVSGAWEDKEAKSYQNGAWAEWVQPLYIFKAGEGALVTLNVSCGGGQSISYNNDSIEWKITGGDQIGLIWATEAVNLEGYRTLNARAKFSHVNGAQPTTIGFFADAPKDYYDALNKRYIAFASFTVESAGKVYSVPVPADVERAYIGCGGAGTGYVYDIWLE